MLCDVAGGDVGMQVDGGETEQSSWCPVGGHLAAEAWPADRVQASSSRSVNCWPSSRRHVWPTLVPDQETNQLYSPGINRNTFIVRLQTLTDWFHYATRARQRQTIYNTVMTYASLLNQWLTCQSIEHKLSICRRHFFTHVKRN